MIVTVRSVTVTIAEPDLVESAVETVVMVGVAAPVKAGVKVIAVPELTPEVALSVPADAGDTERFTVFVNAPVPTTVGVHAVVWTSEMDDGVHETETLVTAGAFTTICTLAVAVV